MSCIDDDSKRSTGIEIPTKKDVESIWITLDPSIP